MVRSQANKEFWNALLCDSVMVHVQVLLYWFPA